MHGEGSERTLYWGFYIGMGLRPWHPKDQSESWPAAGRDPIPVFTRRWRRGCPGMAPSARDGGIPPDRRAVVRHDVPASRRGLRRIGAWDTLTRFSSVIGGHGGTILFYIPFCSWAFFPWSGFLPAALVQALRERGEDPQRAMQFLCAVWSWECSFSSPSRPHGFRITLRRCFQPPLCWSPPLGTGLSQRRADVLAQFSLWLTLGVGCLLGLAFRRIGMGLQRFNAQIVQEFPGGRAGRSRLGPRWRSDFSFSAGWVSSAMPLLTAGRAGLSFRHRLGAHGR